MIDTNAFNLLFGWGVGYEYAQAKSKEDEVKQGKNYYMSALCQIGQFGQLGMIASKLIDLNPASPFKRTTEIFNTVISFASIPTFLFFASVKQDQYEGFAKSSNEKWNNSRISWIPVRLPEKLGNRTVKVINFLAEHNGDIFRIGMIVGSIALIVLGNPHFGSAILVALTYEAMDKMGKVPRKISLFMETYMPVITFLGVFAAGTVFTRLQVLLILPTYLFDSASRFIHQKIDLAIHKSFKKESPTLQDIDAPVVVNKELTFDEINEILDAKSSKYKINPAHCSKWVNGLSEFPSNDNFDLYLTLFDKIDWSKKYSLLENRLKDDDIFIDFLKDKKFPTVSKEDLKKNFNDYMEQLALMEQTALKDPNLSKEAFAAKWLREQFVILVSVLKGDRRVTGTQKDLADAIESCSKILPYLESIQDQDTDKMEFEDMLLKLAIEGGDYCALAIKRASCELTNNILQKGFQSEEDDQTPMKNYELKIARTLQDQRLSIVQQYYKKIVEEMKIPETLSKDTHTFDIYRIVLSLGFVPLTEYERNEVDLGKLFLWETWSQHRDSMYIEYSENLENAIKENGEVNFVNYIQEAISTNSKLSVEQKELILEKYTGWNDDKWTTTEINMRFHRLAFVMLGVLCPNKAK